MTRLRALCARVDDDRGSLPLLMLVMLLGTLLTAATMPVLLNLRTTTSYDKSRVRSLDAAQVGTEILVGRIRNATDSSGGGVSTKLPCTEDSKGQTSVPMTGTVPIGSSGETGGYSVTVDYFLADPIAHPPSDPNNHNAAMLCVPGGGTFDSSSQLVTPSYARITATGTDSGSNVPGTTKGRTVVSIYALHVDNTNISGGIVRVYPDANDNTSWCLDVGSGTPTANVTRVYLAACSSIYPTTMQQTFAYRTDLTLQLVDSIGTTVGGVTYRNGLCIDILNTSSGSPVSGSPLVLQQCNALGSPIWSQQWSFDNWSSLRAPISSSASTGSLSSLCMSTTVTATGHSAAPVTLASCDQNLTSSVDAWLPSPAVGAGASAVAPDTYNTPVQWIDFQQFGRCINDPGDNPNYGFVIVAGCKQNPKRSAVPTNQFYNYKTSTMQMINLVGGSTAYCLTSSGLVGGTTLSRLVTMTQCNSNSVRQRWTRTTPTTSPNTPYSQQYRLVDANGQCLSLATVTAPNDSSYSQWSKLITESCDGSTRQQFNAANNIGPASMQNISEK